MLKGAGLVVKNAELLPTRGFSPPFVTLRLYGLCLAAPYATNTFILLRAAGAFGAREVLVVSAERTSKRLRKNLRTFGAHGAERRVPLRAFGTLELLVSWVKAPPRNCEVAPDNADRNTILQCENPNKEPQWHCYYKRMQDICLDAESKEGYYALFDAGTVNMDDMLAEYQTEFGDSYSTISPTLMDLISNLDASNQERDFSDIALPWWQDRNQWCVLPCNRDSRRRNPIVIYGLALPMSAVRQSHTA